MKNEVLPVGTERLLNRLGYALGVGRTSWSAAEALGSVPAGKEGSEKVVVDPSMADDELLMVSGDVSRRDLNCGLWPEVLRETAVFYSDSMMRRYVAPGKRVKAARDLTYEDLALPDVIPADRIMTSEQLRFRKHQAIMIRHFGNKFFKRSTS